MTDEKILAFFDMSIEQSINKSIMKILFWFDFCFTFFIVAGGLLTRVLQAAFYSVFVIVVFILSDMLFAIWLKFAKNPAQVHSYVATVLLVSTAKLLYGSNIFSKLENEIFSIWYIVIMFFFISLALLGILKKHQILQDLKVTTIKQARKNVEKKNKGLGPIVMPVSITASIAFVLSRVFSRTFDVGLGFILWVLASIWVFMSITSIYNLIVARKYRVADIFKNHINFVGSESEAKI